MLESENLNFILCNLICDLIVLTFYHPVVECNMIIPNLQILSRHIKNVHPGSGLECNVSGFDGLKQTKKITFPT